MIMETETYVFCNATETDEISVIVDLVEWFRGYHLLTKELGVDFWIVWLSQEFTDRETVIIDTSNYKDFQLKLGL